MNLLEMGGYSPHTHKEGLPGPYILDINENNTDNTKIKAYAEVVASQEPLSGETVAEITAAVIDAAKDEGVVKFRQGEATYAIIPPKDELPEIKLYHHPEGKVPGGDATIVIETNTTVGLVKEQIIYGNDPEGNGFFESPTVINTVTPKKQLFQTHTGREIYHSQGNPTTSILTMKQEGRQILAGALARC